MKRVFCLHTTYPAVLNTRKSIELHDAEKSFNHTFLYQKVAKVSQTTALRDFSDLLEKDYIIKSEGHGCNTRYQINIQL